MAELPLGVALKLLQLVAATDTLLVLSVDAIDVYELGVRVDAYRSTACEATAPQVASATAQRAQFDGSVNAGIATAARIPIRTMTTTSSISVNPARCIGRV